MTKDSEYDQRRFDALDIVVWAVGGLCLAGSWFVGWEIGEAIRATF